MTKKNNKRKYILIFSLAALLVVAIAIGLSQAKYKTEKQMQGKIKFTATLYETIKIQEHPATRSDNGSYTVDKGATPVQEQEYTFMPGVDLPKDPFITVSGKTNIPAWLYVEVVPGGIEKVGPDGSKVDNVTFTVDPEHWIKLDGVAGEHEGGQLYAYKTTITTADTQTGSGENIKLHEFYILAEDENGNTLTVSQYATRDDKVTLDFYAYICQAVTDSAADDFQLPAQSNDTPAQG